MPFTRWSLAKLSRYLRGQGIAISPAQLGRVLKRAGVSFQRTRSWKQSPDPEYEAKAKRILALYRERPPNGVVISFDEKGPESLCPTQGRGWARRGRPERLRATYNRRHGVRYLVAALDVHADYLRARLRPRRDGASTLVFMKQIRLAYPRRLRLYWIQDNLSCHWTPAIREWAAVSNVELVPNPHLRQLPQPDRESLRRDRRVRLRQRRLPRLGRLRPRHGPAHPLPQLARGSSRAQDPSREATPAPN